MSPVPTRVPAPGQHVHPRAKLSRAQLPLPTGTCARGDRRTSRRIDPQLAVRSLGRRIRDSGTSPSTADVMTLPLCARGRSRGFNARAVPARAGALRRLHRRGGRSTRWDARRWVRPGSRHRNARRSDDGPSHRREDAAVTRVTPRPWCATPSPCIRAGATARRVRIPLLRRSTGARIVAARSTLPGRARLPARSRRRLARASRTTFASPRLHAAPADDAVLRLAASFSPATSLAPLRPLMWVCAACRAASIHSPSGDHGRRRVIPHIRTVGSPGSRRR